jgi:hypothetical protein
MTTRQMHNPFIWLIHNAFCFIAYRVLFFIVIERVSVFSRWRDVTGKSL